MDDFLEVAGPAGAAEEAGKNTDGGMAAGDGSGGGGMVDSSSKAKRAEFLRMVARADLRSEFPEQYEKHWQNQGASGNVQTILFRIAGHPCELTFSLFFGEGGGEVLQTGIVVKYKDEAILNEVRKGDALDFNQARRIDPISFLKQTFTDARPGDDADTISYTLSTDDDSEPEVFRAVQRLTGKGEPELRVIWGNLLATNAKRSSHEQVSPIILTWLKKERDRIDLEYLRFARVLQPREKDIVHFSAPGHTCTVLTRRMPGSFIRSMIDDIDPEWWGGTWYAMNKGSLVRVPHDPSDRYQVLSGYESDFQFPVEEIFIDNRQVYAVMSVGKEALVWRTRHQVAPAEAAKMPVVAVPKKKASPRRAPAVEPGLPLANEAPAVSAEPVNPFVVAKAEKDYMAALAGKTPGLKQARQAYLKLLYSSDSERFCKNAEEMKLEMHGAAQKALKRDAARLRKELAVLDAYITIFYLEDEA